MPKRISLGLARQQGAAIIAFYCVADPDIGFGRRSGRGCIHRGELPIDAVIDRYGEHASIDDVRARCSACGRNVVDVRPERSRAGPHNHGYTTQGPRPPKPDHSGGK